MATSVCIKIKYENLRSLDSALIDTTYTAVGSAFANPVRIIKINNTTDANLIISYDGINDKDFVAANGYFVFDYAANQAQVGGDALQPVGDRVYVKQEGAAPTTGTVYVTILYTSPA